MSVKPRACEVEMWPYLVTVKSFFNHFYGLFGRSLNEMCCALRVYRCSRFPSWHRKWWCVTVPSCSRRNGVIWFSFEMTVIKLIRLTIICDVHTLLRNQIMSQDTDARKVNRHSLKGKDSHDKKGTYCIYMTAQQTQRADLTHQHKEQWTCTAPWKSP